MSEFLGVDIKKFYDGGFQLYQIVLTLKVLEATEMDHCNGFPTPNKVEAPPGTYVNGSEANIDWPNSYAYVIGMMLYLESNTRPNIFFAVHQCTRFTHKTKASNETTVNSIYPYIQGTKDNSLVFNPSKQLVVDCYDDTDFA